MRRPLALLLVVGWSLGCSADHVNRRRVLSAPSRRVSDGVDAFRRWRRYAWLSARGSSRGAYEALQSFHRGKAPAP